MTGSISLIKNCGLDLQFLTDQLLENSIINEREKSEIIDDHTKKQMVKEWINCFTLFQVPLIWKEKYLVFS